MRRNRIVIGVVGSGSQPHLHLSAPLGKWLGESGYDLINGGGRGVMEAVAQAFAEVPERAGLAIGIIPSLGSCEDSKQRAEYLPMSGYPNPSIDLPIYTHLHLSGDCGKETASRNHIVILTADIVVALPGGAGTRSEIELALEYGKPLVIVNPAGEWDEFKEKPAAMAGSIDDAIEAVKKLERRI
ncbi:MAG: molybdenum cofactor carrier protein [Nitrospinales bacterium]